MSIVMTQLIGWSGFYFCRNRKVWSCSSYVCRFHRYTPGMTGSDRYPLGMTGSDRSTLWVWPDLTDLPLRKTVRVWPYILLRFAYIPGWTVYCGDRYMWTTSILNRCETVFKGTPIGFHAEGVGRWPKIWSFMTKKWRKSWKSPKIGHFWVIFWCYGSPLSRQAS